MLTARELWSMDKKGLREVLERGTLPHDIAGYTYRGVSLGLPRVAVKLSWLTFQKVFVKDALGVRGFNVRLKQDGIDAPSVPKLRGGKPFTFGHFRVTPASHAPAGKAGLLLDYGASPENRGLLARLRDPIVCVNEGSSDLLLGWSYLDLFGRSIATPSYFTLQREGKALHLPH